MTGATMTGARELSESEDMSEDLRALEESRKRSRKSKDPAKSPPAKRMKYVTSTKCDQFAAPH
jgi:hypothetical protein